MITTPEDATPLASQSHLWTAAPVAPSRLLPSSSDVRGAARDVDVVVLPAAVALDSPDKTVEAVIGHSRDTRRRPKEEIRRGITGLAGRARRRGQADMVASLSVRVQAPGGWRNLAQARTVPDRGPQQYPTSLQAFPSGGALGSSGARGPGITPSPEGLPGGLVERGGLASADPAHHIRDDPDQASQAVGTASIQRLLQTRPFARWAHRVMVGRRMDSDLRLGLHCREECPIVLWVNFTRRRLDTASGRRARGALALPMAAGSRRSKVQHGHQLRDAGVDGGQH